MTDWREIEERVYMRTGKRLPVVLVRGEGVRVWDEELCRGMHHLYRDMKLVCEPAAAAATAALLGPLRSRLDGKRVALIVCGSNIDEARFAELVARGAG